MKLFSSVVLALALQLQAGIVSDTYLGYSIDLPANWVQVKTRDLQHHFKDGTGQYPSRISILRYTIDKADYPQPEAWTQAQFIAYKLAVETSVYPFGTVAYFDSSVTRKLGNDWSPEAFSVLFPADGQRTYCEFIRYCAHGDYGYEIYAIGDSTDMMNKVDFYAGIIATVSLSAPTGIRDSRLTVTPATQPDPHRRWVDPQGRTLVPETGVSRKRQTVGIRFPYRLPSP